LRVYRIKQDNKKDSTLHNFFLNFKMSINYQKIFAFDL
jgi:hypothetical protein